MSLNKLESTYKMRFFEDEERFFLSYVSVQNRIEEKPYAYFGKTGLKTANFALKEFEILQKNSVIRKLVYHISLFHQI